MKYLPAIFIMFLVFGVSAQNKGKGKTRSKSKPKIQLTTLTGEGDDCTKTAFTGTVVKRNFAEDEITLVSFVLREPDDNRIYINVDSEFLREKGRYELSETTSALSLKRNVKVGVYGCGASGLFFWLESVTAY